MNERIKELALQAGYKDSGAVGITGMDDFLARFSDLIVQECIQVTANKQSVWPFAYLDFVELLMNHFKDNDES